MNNNDDWCLILVENYIFNLIYACMYSFISTCFYI